MPQDFVVSLGGIPFERFEIPERLAFGVEQQLKVHKFIGGKRRIHALGRDDPPIEWSGRFRGAGAVGKALNFKAMALQAQPVPLIWDQCAYTVLIRKFRPEEAKFYEVPYSITVEVLSDDAFPDAEEDNPSPQQQVSSDGQAATDQAAQIDDPQLNSQVPAAAQAADITTSGDTSIPSGSTSVLPAPSPTGGDIQDNSVTPSQDAAVGQATQTGDPTAFTLPDGSTAYVVPGL